MLDLPELLGLIQTVQADELPLILPQLVMSLGFSLED